MRRPRRKQHGHRWCVITVPGWACGASDLAGLTTPAQAMALSSQDDGAHSTLGAALDAFWARTLRPEIGAVFILDSVDGRISADWRRGSGLIAPSTDHKQGGAR